jgi:hypothetical protein
VGVVLWYMGSTVRISCASLPAFSTRSQDASGSRLKSARQLAHRARSQVYFFYLHYVRTTVSCSTSRTPTVHWRSRVVDLLATGLYYLAGISVR